TEWLMRAIAAAVLFALAVAARDTPASATPVRRAAAYLVDLVNEAVGAVGALLRSTLVWQLLVLGSVGVLVLVLNDVWYVSHVRFPDSIREPCRVAMILVDNVAEPFMVFTNDPDFQTTILPVIPLLSTVRLAIVRAVGPAYVPLLRCRDGVGQEFRPAADGLVLFALAPVALVGVGCAMQVLPDASGWARSRWFWAFGAVGGLVFAGVAFLASDVPVLLYSLAFDDADMVRTYTSRGWVGLGAALVFVGACVALHTLLSLDKPQKQRMGARFASVRERVAAGLTWLTAPSLVIAFAAVFVCVVVALAPGGAPVRNVGIAKLKSGRPDYLRSTAVDGMSAIIGKAVITLAESIIPFASLILITTATTAFILEKFACEACLCLPVPSLSKLKGLGEDAGDAFESFGSSLGSLRRLLEHHPEQTRLGTRAVARRLL
ncbi:MAG: hypothetical protein Q7V62_15720, partial [Actinomycetota bacterium]|nr:hypothetical protein [Actinomycetota bacterium]